MCWSLIGWTKGMFHCAFGLGNAYVPNSSSKYLPNLNRSSVELLYIGCSHSLSLSNTMFSHMSVHKCTWHQDTLVLEVNLEIIDYSSNQWLILQSYHLICDVCAGHSGKDRSRAAILPCQLAWENGSQSRQAQVNPGKFWQRTQWKWSSIPSSSRASITS